VTGQRDVDRTSIHSLILTTASALVPRFCREEWLTEWKSELWYVQHGFDSASGHSRREREALVFCLGSFRDAVWVRLDRGKKVRTHDCLRSPAHCLLVLATIATIAVFFFVRASGPLSTILVTAQDRSVMVGCLWAIGIAMFALPQSASRLFGDYSSSSNSSARAKRYRRWSFFAIKLAFTLSIVCCGSLDLASTVGGAEHLPQSWAVALQVILLGPGAVVAYLVAVRWTLSDQRRRCPVCLRLLTASGKNYQTSQMLLGASGQEYFCINGHGFLQVSEGLATNFAGRWLDLESIAHKPHLAQKP
jgi:hypothetical protein